MIPYGRQEISEDDILAVVKVLRSEYLTQGPVVPRFEQSVSRYCGAGYGVAVNSGTSALHVACLALGIGPGDLVWTSPITFVASANCALYCGARVDFVDIDPRTFTLCPKALQAKLERAEQTGEIPNLLIVVHLCGQSCDMEAIHALSRRYGFKIIEDAAHALGATYKGMPVGCCRWSDITITSFHPVKIVTTGEGGMALTNDSGLADKMSRLRSHGITRNPEEMVNPPDGPWSYQQIELGFNYRMTDLQAALGCSQMERLDSFVSRRRFLAGRYNRLLDGLPLRIPWQSPDTDSSWHLYVVRLCLEDIAFDHCRVFTALREEGIGVNLHYIPVHTQPYYRRMGFAAGLFPEAEQYYQEALSLPIYPALSDTQQERIVGALNRVLKPR